MIKAVVAKHDDAMGEVQKQEALRSHLRKSAYEQGQADIKMLTPRVAAHKDAVKRKAATWARASNSASWARR